MPAQSASRSSMTSAVSLVVSLTLFLGISLLSAPDLLDADVEAVMEM